MTYVGTMRSATVGSGQPWADDAAQRRLAHAIFGTPLDRRVTFTEVHGFWYGCLELFWPRANLLHVWVEE